MATGGLGWGRGVIMTHYLRISICDSPLNVFQFFYHYFVYAEDTEDEVGTF